MEWADIVMISNISNYGGPYTARVAEEAVKRGKFVHFDTDDLLTDLYKEHRLYKVYKDNQLDEITKFIYHNSHLVSVTQEEFAKEIQQFTRGGLAIIRNAIDCNLPCWNAPKVKTKQVKIGWAGGIHHRPDVKVFAGVPNIVNSKVGKENIIWDFYGHPPANNPPEEKWQEEAWKEYLSSFARGNNAKNFRVHYAHGPDAYGVFYSNMDIAIAPLANNRFNSMKSDVKVAEASIYGVPLIASDIGCYRDTIVNGKNGYLLPSDASPMEWARVLTKVIKDKQHREEMGRKINKLKDSYDLNKVVWDRLWLYEKAIEDFKWNFKFASNDVN